MACKEGCCEAEEPNEKRELISHIVTLCVGIVFLIIAFTLSYVDPLYEEIEWSLFSDSAFYSSYSFVAFIFYTIGYLYLATDLVKGMVEECKEHNYINEFTLMFVATLGAYCICEFPEAMLVVIFNTVGEMLEDYATGKSRQSISKLVNSMPLYAHLVGEDGKTTDVDPSEVKIGSLLEIRPGEKIAIDGKIVKGSTSLDLSSLDGESLPKDAATGDAVYSGSVNLTSAITIETVKEFKDSTLSMIMSLVEDEESKKAKSEKFITKFAKFYTPSVVLIAVIVFLAGFGSCGFVWAEGGEEWLYRALSILLIACQCALVISVPISFFAGIGSASKSGILIKGSSSLESLASAKAFVFDKTGTLTEGVFTLKNDPDPDMLRIAASLESKSTHPLATAIVEGNKEELLKVENFENIPGKGIKGDIDSTTYVIGNKAFLMECQVEDFAEEDTPYKVLYLGIRGGRKLVSFVVADKVKDNARTAISNLKKEGVRDTIMLSGDDAKIVSKTKEEIGLDAAYGELLPQQKLDKVKELSAGNGKVAYVGDGINDSPSLLAADVGMAMGALGSDAAIEASDIVIMDDDLRKLAETKRLSKKTMINVYECISFALTVKIVVMVVVALGYGGSVAMILGTLCDTGVMALCVLNAARMLLYKPKYIERKKK